MSSSKGKGKDKGKGKERASSPLRNELLLDADAPIPSIEPMAEGEAQPAALLENLPFFSNFGDLPAGGQRFVNVSDVRNRANFARGESADLSRDPFETRIIMNGVCLNDLWVTSTPDRPPFFDVEWNMDPREMMNLIMEYFPGVNMYPELRKPAGSTNLMGMHWVNLALDLYDAEGMLQRRHELRTKHVMALLMWQLLDFQDIVFLIKEPLHHDQTPSDRFRWRELTDDQRFIVLPIHLPGHWAVGIYDRMNQFSWLWNSAAPGQAGNPTNLNCVELISKYIRKALGEDEVTYIHSEVVGGTKQHDAVSCGWHVAEFVRNFFRENRGMGEWEVSDWAGSALIRTKPSPLSHAEASILSWMFAIRSELNGTGEAVRTPVSMPVVSLDRMREIKTKYGLLSQRQIIDQGLHDAAVTPIIHGQQKAPREITPSLTQGLGYRFRLADTQRGIDVRTARNHPSSSAVSNFFGPLAKAQEIIQLAKMARLSLNRDTSRTPIPIMNMDGSGLSPMPRGPQLPQNLSIGSRISQMSDQMQGVSVSRAGSEEGRSQRRDSDSSMGMYSHLNPMASRFVDTSRAKITIPMPAVQSGFQGWGPVIAQHQRKQQQKQAGPSSEEQARSRAQRAKEQKWRQ